MCFGIQLAPRTAIVRLLALYLNLPPKMRSQTPPPLKYDFSRGGGAQCSSRTTRSVVDLFIFFYVQNQAPFLMPLHSALQPAAPR